MKKMVEALKYPRFLLEYAGVMFFLLLIKPLPRVVLVWTSAVIGRLMFLIPPFRKLVLANLRVAFPDYDEARRRQIGRDSFVNLIRTLLEFFWFTNRPDRIARHVSIAPESRAMLDAHRAAGENIIFVTPHLGNWEATGLKIAQSSGLDFAVVVRPPRNPLLNRLIRKSRGCNGNEVIDAKGSVKKVLHAVKQGKSLATLIDQNTRVRDGGVFVNYFGLPVPSSKAPAFFARMSPKVRTMVGGGIRQPNGDILAFHVKLPKPEADYQDDGAMIQDLIKITEDLVRRYPEQYLWFYRRFQYIPRDADAELRAKYPYYSALAPDKFYFKKK